MTDHIEPNAQLTLQQRIDQQDTWTFSECLGLASDYNMKIRMVIAMVYAAGKTYVERDLQSSATKSQDPTA